MSTISASTTSTTAYKVTADTTGTLVLQTGATPTTAVTIDGSQNVTLAGNITLNNGAADGAQLTLASSGYSNWNIDNYSGNFRWYYNTTEYMRLDASGNLGLATTSPTARLTIGLQSYTVSATSGMIRFKNDQNSADGCIQSYSVGSNIGTDVVYGSNFYVDTSGQFQRFNTSRESSFQIVSRDGSVYWGTGGTGATAVERARIDSSGILRVNNTSTPSGNGGFGGEIAYIGNGSNGSLFYTTASAGAGTAVECTRQNDGAGIYFFRNGSAAGFINITTGAISVNNSSDYRLKENVSTLSGSLAKVMQVRPVTFTWKENGSAGKSVIAHELQEVFPDVVFGEKDAVNEDGSIKPQSVALGNLVPDLIAAIQEQQAIIETLTNRITALEAK